MLASNYDFLDCDQFDLMPFKDVIRYRLLDEEMLDSIENEVLIKIEPTFRTANSI